MKNGKKYFVGLILLIFLIIEWVLDMIVKMWKIIHEGTRDIATALGEIYNELNNKPGEPDSGKV